LGAAPTICAAVLARDEAGFLEDCLASLAWADELLVVVDAASTDATEDIARRHTERVETHPWRGFGGQRNLALELATTDWVFFVDADERVLPSLAEEVRRAVRDGGDLAGYRVPRRNSFACCGGRAPATMSPRTSTRSPSSTGRPARSPNRSSTSTTRRWASSERSRPTTLVSKRVSSGSVVCEPAPTTSSSSRCGSFAVASSSSAATGRELLASPCPC
jgi:glycosyltransferase involved in cell wall biosynthesis